MTILQWRVREHYRERCASNMREIHFSRNPKMAQLLHEYEYVREFGEGVDRMYREMEEAGLPEPEYKTVAFMVHATIKNKKYLVGSESTTPQVNPQDKTQATPQDKILEFCKIPRSKNEIVAYMAIKIQDILRKSI